MSSRSTERLTIRRTIDAKPEAVFAAFLDPGALSQWWCPDGYHAAEVVIDARVGGEYRVTMTPTVGSGPPVNIRGEYREVRAPIRLVMTHEFDHGSGRQFDDLGLSGHTTLVTVQLTDVAGKTELVLTQELIPSGASEVLRYGWSGIVQRLDAFARATG